MSSEVFIDLFAAVLALALFLSLGLKVGSLAKRRGRSFKRWSIIGFFVPVPAVIVLFMMENRAAPIAARHS